MAFFLLCIYLVVVLIRPQELVGLEQLPIVLYTLIATVIPFVFAKKNAGSPQIYLLICLVVIIVVSAVLNGWSGGIIKLVPEFVSSAVVPYILFSKLTTTPGRHRALLLISIFSALVMVHNGISQTLSDIGVGWAGSRLSQGTRITYLGTLGDPNDLGMFFVMVLPFAVYFMTLAKSLAKAFWLIAIVGLLYGVFLTNSRGAFLGVLSLFGIWALQKYGVKKTVMFALFLLPVIAIIASKFRTIDAEEESAAGRIEAWYSGFQMLIQNPFFGVGMNNFTNHHMLTAHNSYVLIVAELGVVGFTTWMSFLLLTFFMLYQIAFYDAPFFKKELPISPMKSEVLATEVLEEILLAKVSLFSMLGFVITAFFLSRSYSLILFIYASIGISVYYRTLPLIPRLIPITLSQLFSKLLLISFSIIIFLYMVVRVLN